MTITEQQAIDYLSGYLMELKTRIGITDNNDKYEEEIFVLPEDRILCNSLEIVLQKAKVNTLFQGDGS